MSGGHLVLIGYRATGKTATAQRLSAALGRPWFDADQEFTRRAGRSIQQIFADQGEPAFRDLEAELLAELLEREPAVIATGGGVVLRQDNRDRLTAAGTVVWLRARPETILARLAADETSAAMRPALTSKGTADEVFETLAEREPIYAALAQLSVDTDDQSPEQVAEAVLARLGLGSGVNPPTQSGGSA